MEEKDFEDELARRRAARQQTKVQTDAAQPPEEEKIHFTGKDILAFVIAAYQVLLPVLAGMVGILLFTWLLFKVLFS